MTPSRISLVVFEFLKNALSTPFFGVRLHRNETKTILFHNVEMECLLFGVKKRCLACIFKKFRNTMYDLRDGVIATPTHQNDPKTIFRNAEMKCLLFKTKNGVLSAFLRNSEMPPTQSTITSHWNEIVPLF